MTDKPKKPATKKKAKPKIDPRMAKRRQVVAEANTRRRFRALAVVAGVIVFVFAMVGIFRSPVLDIDRIEVKGAKHTTVAAILGATGVATQGHPMIAVDRFALAGKIERLPWVASAEVDRKWPSTLRISITERVAIGAIGAPGGVALLDGTGRVLGVVKEQPAGTIAIIAADKIAKPGQIAGEGLRFALAVLHALSKPLAEQADTVQRLPGKVPTYEVGLKGGVTIRFGEANQLAQKVTAAEAVYAVEKAAGTVIDVRVPRSPAVTHSVIPAPTQA
ncbi:MAG: FtsQ-type POTRA domain-containing protein [Acidimicrobiales bacterium]|nr:FtsQ-type POTRA domain-containing protein [Acidimicrobiales bacterium]